MRKISSDVIDRRPRSENESDESSFNYGASKAESIDVTCGQSERDLPRAQPQRKQALPVIRVKSVKDGIIAEAVTNGGAEPAPPLPTTNQVKYF